MRAGSAEAIDFAATPRGLADALAFLERCGVAGGGALDADERRAALEAFARQARRSIAYAPRWRHGDVLRRLDDLVWTTGRLPLPPRRSGSVGSSPSSAPQNAHDSPAALAVANAAGLVHVGSTLLVDADARNDPRFVLRPLADAMREWPKRVATIRRRIVRPAGDAFIALGDAFQNCGAYVEIARGVALDAPLQLVWTQQPGVAQAVFPQTVVRVRAGASATIVERHLGESDSFVLGTVEAEVEPGATLDYVVIARVDGGIRSAFVRAARVAAGATMRWHLAELGGTLGRSFVRARLTGPGACAEVNAAHFARGFEHVDVRADIVHAAADGRSRTIARAAALDRAQIRLGGNVRVLRDGRGARAAFAQAALDLGRDAYVYGRPTLEIGANAVAVSHAASIGGLDESALFYAQQRGIARGSAAKMIALAFYEPALAGFPSIGIRDEIRSSLDEGLDSVGDTFEM